MATDFLEVVKNMKDKNMCKYGATIQKFLLKKERLCKAELVHKSCTCNMEVHNLVKAVISLESGHHLWLTSPHIACIPSDIMQ